MLHQLSLLIAFVNPTTGQSVIQGLLLLPDYAVKTRSLKMEDIPGKLA